LEGPNESDQLTRLQEDEPPSDVVIGQRAKGFVAKRHRFAELARRGDVKGHVGRHGHGLVNPAESINRDLFDEELFALFNLEVVLFDK